jgi:hypothetical protein
MQVYNAGPATRAQPSRAASQALCVGSTGPNREGEGLTEAVSKKMFATRAVGLVLW